MPWDSQDELEDVTVEKDGRGYLAATRPRPGRKWLDRWSMAQTGDKQVRSRMSAKVQMVSEKMHKCTM